MPNISIVTGLALTYQGRFTNIYNNFKHLK
jgi:hypothetical protein